MTDISRSSEQGSRAFAGALAFVGLVCVAYPFADLILNNWPIRPGDITWRYQFVGLMSQMLVTPLIGVVFLTGGGILGRRALLLKLGGWLSIAGSALILLLTVSFVLDASELRAVVAEGERSVFNLSSLRAIVKNVITSGGFAYVGVGALRAARRVSARDRAAAKDPKAGLVGA